MTYKGSQVNKQTLDPTLQQEIEGIKSKVNSSWQKDVYNDANITNLGPLSASRVFNFNDWDDDNSKLDSLYINIPVGNAFSGLIKLTLSGDWNVGNSMGGAEVVYNFSKVGNVVGTNTMTINYISPLFATCFYIRKLVEDVSRVYIPITKAPNTRNGVSIKVEIFSTYNIFDVVNRITVARDPAISQPHPWTPQIPSAVQHGTGNNYILGGAMTLGGNLSISKDIPLIEMGVPNSNSGSSAQFLLNASTTQDFGLEFRKNNVTYMVAHGQKQVAFLGHDDVWFTIQDLKQSASDVKTNVAAAITDKGVPTSPTATGTQMAANIRAIPTGGRKANGLLISSSTLASFNYKGGGIVSMAYIDLTGLNFTPSIIVLMTSTGNGNMSYSIFTSFNDPTGFTSSTKISLYNSNLFSNSPNHNLSHIAISGGYRFPVTSQSASYTWYAYE